MLPYIASPNELCRTMRMRRIIVISDKENNNTQYERVLSKVYENHFLRNFDTFPEALKFTKLNTVHYIVIDMCENLADFLAKIEKFTPNTKTILITTENNSNCISMALRYNSTSIIFDKNIDKELNTAIEKCENEERFYSQEIASVVLQEMVKKDSAKLDFQPSLSDLTKREIQILELILEELTNFEIAERLFVSPRTIDTHRRNLLQKIRAKNTVGLVIFAFRNKLIV